MMLTEIYHPEYMQRWKNMIYDFARKTGKEDLDDYYEEGRWRTRRGASGLQVKNVSIVDGLRTKYNDYLIRNPIEIHVGVTNFSKIYVKGVTTLETESMLKLQNLYIDINDASKANLDIEVENGFMAALSGASKINIKGKAMNADISASGASSFEAKDLMIRNAKISLSGASRAEIHASESLDADLKGATKLICTGSPKNIRQNASRGSGIIVK